jgi:MFS family permease
VLFGASGAFGATVIVAALMPSYLGFAAVLILVGFTAITIMTTANGIVQSTTAPAMRGRVMALYMAVFMGGTPLGSPIIGALSNALGPRWAMVAGGASGFVALGIGVAYWAVLRGGRVRIDRSRRIPLAFYYPRTPTQAETDLALDETVARVS